MLLHVQLGARDDLDITYLNDQALSTNDVGGLGKVSRDQMCVHIHTYIYIYMYICL